VRYFPFCAHATCRRRLSFDGGTRRSIIIPCGSSTKPLGAGGSRRLPRRRVKRQGSDQTETREAPALKPSSCSRSRFGDEPCDAHAAVVRRWVRGLERKGRLFSPNVNGEIHRRTPIFAARRGRRFRWGRAGGSVPARAGRGNRDQVCPFFGFGGRKGICMSARARPAPPSTAPADPRFLPPALVHVPAGVFAGVLISTRFLGNLPAPPCRHRSAGFCADSKRNSGENGLRSRGF